MPEAVPGGMHVALLVGVPEGIAGAGPRPVLLLRLVLCLVLSEAVAAFADVGLGGLMVLPLASVFVRGGSVAGAGLAGLGRGEGLAGLESGAAWLVVKGRPSSWAMAACSSGRHSWLTIVSNDCWEWGEPLGELAWVFCVPDGLGCGLPPGLARGLRGALPGWLAVVSLELVWLSDDMAGGLLGIVALQMLTAWVGIGSDS